ncbi:MAG: FIST C-terminal domain-containing protein [Planctomycetes bacterium]|nr:FIST C-terminal domain-containing protein [Planctomycetota bacterium]
MEMRFASSITSATSAEQALAELLAPAEQRVTAGMVDLALLFSTPHFEDDLEEIVERVGGAFPNAALIGCTAEGTIGCDKELERIPSLSLLVGSLPDVVIRPFHLRQPMLEAAQGLFDWERMVGVLPENHPTFIAFADPFRVDIHAFLDQVNRFFPGSSVVGGVASAAHAPNQNRLIVGGKIVREGIVGVTLTGNLLVETVVSQGCRPIGKPFVITRGERNVIYQLGGKAPLEQLHSVLVGLSTEDEELARQSLFVGRVIDERRGQFTRGDFLIHHIIGVDRKTGAIGIAGHARTGATVQFHVRDAASADEDLRAMLASRRHDDIQAAMLFGCNGRGTHMWPTPGHDVGVVRELLGNIPVAGFFCGGEFGPVGGNNFIHGFTASIALLRPAPPTAAG